MELPLKIQPGSGHAGRISAYTGGHRWRFPAINCFSGQPEVPGLNFVSFIIFCRLYWVNKGC
jgi:hypothetical protein